jgi:predicted  nucleic acid-binding Zn-ribbon protein
MISEIEKMNRQTQAALDLNRDRLSRSTTKLESVHNTQEFQAANKEIDQLKKLNETLEAQAKKSTADMEIVQKEVQSLDEQIQKLQTERDSKAAVLSGKETQFKADIAELSSERLKYSSQIEAKILAQYNRIRPARGGIGIVPAVGGRCKGCNMMVPPQLYNEIHRGTTLHSCPSCHRLLFVPTPTAPTAEGQSPSPSIK